MRLWPVCVFALRGAGLLSGTRWPLVAPLGYLSYSINTTLLLH